MGAGASSSPVVTSVAGLSWMMPALARAMTPRNTPMPAEMASFRARGTDSTIHRRTRTTLSTTKMTPDTNTAPSATSHGCPIPSTTP